MNKTLQVCKPLKFTKELANQFHFELLEHFTNHVHEGISRDFFNQNCPSKSPQTWNLCDRLYLMSFPIGLKQEEEEF